MTLTLLGGHWWHPDRNAHGRTPFSVELLYVNDPPSGFDWGATVHRVMLMRLIGAKVALRLDWSHGQALPPVDDDAAVADYIEAAKQVAIDPVLNQCSWLICGNEPNLAIENLMMGRPMPAYWVARVVYGHATPLLETDNVYQTVRTFNDHMAVLLPAVAPYSPEMGGTRNMPAVINGRQQWAPWESYQYDLWASAYDNNWHAPIGEVKSAYHTYGAPNIAAIGPGEPFVDVREPSYGAQFGTRWLQDGLHLQREAQELVYGSGWPAWVVVSESNVLRPPQSPMDDYPDGWWRQVVNYVHTQPNIEALAAFVDQDYGSHWADTAMTIPAGRLPLWDADHNYKLEHGW